MKVKAFVFAGLALVLVGLGLGNSVAQAPTWEWTRTFGGRENDFGFSVQQTSDGGYILLGTTYSFGAGSGDIWLIKTDADGNKIWERTFGGSKGEWGYSVQQTSDDGYILLGETCSFGAGECDVWLIKTDADGNAQWDKTFGGRESDFGTSVQQTSDGGFILLGQTSSFKAGEYDVWLIKTDADGNVQWDKIFSRNDWDVSRSVQQTSDSGYILLGYTASFITKRFDVWLVKTDANGNIEWERTFGGSEDDRGYSMQQTSDSGFILLGYTASFGTEGSPDVWLIKTDADGNRLWDRTFGGSDCDKGTSVQQTSDGGYILLGSTCSFGIEGSWDVWLIKTDASGNKEWDKTFGGRGSDYGTSAQQASDGSYILLGTTSSFGAGLYDIWLIKYRP